MSEQETVELLQEKLTHLEKHVGEQDAEIYHLSKRIDKLLQMVQVQKLQLEALTGRNDGEMPANEKPPHY